MAKQRTFRMHPRLLFQTIQRQAGTLAKAITEGVMNSVEAGASRVDVTLEPHRVLIADDGRGFQSLEEIENWFETFGQPHDASEGKIWANFRIGRGQMFSFGRNTWRTRKYLMEVDLAAAAKDADTLAYSLQEAEEAHEGCQITIDLYHRLLPGELQQTERELKQLVKWVATPVYLNGKQISQDPAKAKWDYEDPLCYVKLRKAGGLAVYNLGVFVREYPPHQFGCGGDIVSKHQLRLNQARSDVLTYNCPVWQNVRKQINSFVGKAIRKKPALTAAEKDFLAGQMLAGELSPDDFESLRIFSDVSGKSHSWGSLLRITSTNFYSEGERYDRIADEIHQQRLAFVFSLECLDRFQVGTAKELIEKLEQVAPCGDTFPLEYKPLQELSVNFRRGFVLVDKDSLTPTEQIVLDVCKKAGGLLVAGLQVKAGLSVTPRNYVVGISDAAAGWTDGSTFIAISRSWLQRRRFCRVTDFVELGSLLLHEYCHCEADTESHTHSPEFYQAFHDGADSIGFFAERALAAIPKSVEKFRKQISRSLTRTLDKIEVAKRLTASFDQLDRQGEILAARTVELESWNQEVKQKKKASRKRRRTEKGES